MKSIRHRIGILGFFLCALAWSLPAFGQSTEAPTVVMVFRHADPVMPAMGQERDQDPSLNDAGNRRAQALIETVEEAGVTSHLFLAVETHAGDSRAAGRAPGPVRDDGRGQPRQTGGLSEAGGR